MRTHEMIYSKKIIQLLLKSNSQLQKVNSQKIHSIESFHVGFTYCRISLLNQILTQEMDQIKLAWFLKEKKSHSIINFDHLGK